MIRRCVALTLLFPALSAAARPSAAQQQTQPAQTQPAQTQPAPGTLLLTGVVLDAGTLQPVASARVRVPDARVDVLTDAEGRFVAPGVAPGSYGGVVTQLGYTQRAQIFTVGPGEPEPQVLLEPQPVMLEALNVRVGLLERRARISGWSVMAFNHDLLTNSTARDAAKFVREMAHVRPVPCGQLNTGSGPVGRRPGEAIRELGCIVVRGVVQRACVLIDDTPSSFGELSLYRPADMYRVEVFAGGRAILVYTSQYAERIEHTGYTPPPLQSEIDTFCYRNAPLN